MKGPGTFVGRVALHGALTGILAGTAVAVAIVWIADGLARRHEDRYLLDVCEQFALELRERGADPIWLTADETWELEHTGIDVALFDKQRRMAGHKALISVAPDTCVHQGSRRVCARAANALIAVMGREQASFSERNEDLLHAASIAVLLTGLIAAVSARWLARVVVRPLRELRDSVAMLPEHPGDVQLSAHADVSEVDALRVALRDTLSRLSSSLAQSERFARDAAHELRTPLTAILGELELIAERAPEGERDDIMRVHTIAQRQSKLVERLLVLAQQDVENLVERVDLVDVVETAVEALSAHERVAVTLPEGAALVDGDSALLVSMVGNALDNALKFSQRAVSCTLEASGSSATISVQDDGPGIDENERQRVFLPFYRSAAMRSSGVRGHGIGLALIAHVASLHGGVARFAQAERGARLEIDLPLAT